MAKKPINLITTIFLLLTLLPIICLAEENFLHMLVQGKYLLVGKALDSNDTYQGKVKIQDDNGNLIVVRNIEGKTIKGAAAIESASGGDAKVLRIRFTDNNINYEQTCMVGSDLDNYARISCYLYHTNKRTLQPGLEVLFNDHTAK